jgi:hypothetical protein
MLKITKGLDRSEGERTLKETLGQRYRSLLADEPTVSSKDDDNK